MKKFVLVIGPFPDPISGVSIANQQVVRILNQDSDYSVKSINTSYPIFQDQVGKMSLKKIIVFIKPLFKIFQIFGKDLIYITPGETYYGVLKYSPFILLASLLKKEIVIHIHGNNLKNTYEKLKGAKKKYFHYLFSKTSKGIVLSHSLKDNLTPFMEENKVFLLNNFAEDFLITEEDNLKTDILRIIFLSNLMIGKGIVEVLESLKKLEALNIKYEAVIAGTFDVSNKELFYRYFNELKNTQYVGIVSGNRKKELLNWANIFILPTYLMEGQPISIIEALATSNVIITTRLVGILDIVQEKSGYFVDPKNVESIVSTLKYINEHKESMKAIAEYNKTLFMEKFTVQHFEKNLKKILNS